MSSLLKFDGILVFFLLLICIATYGKGYFPSFYEKDSQKSIKSTLWKLSRIGERLSPWISISLIILGFRHFFVSNEK